MNPLHGFGKINCSNTDIKLITGLGNQFDDMDSFPAVGVGDVGAVAIYGFKTVQASRQLIKRY